MKTNYLIYYVLKLITKGQEWQYKNLNGKGDRPKYGAQNETYIED